MKKDTNGIICNDYSFILKLGQPGFLPNLMHLNILSRPKQNQVFSEEAIQLKMNEIKADASWLQAVREKAIANRVKLIQQLRADAIWVLQHP